MDKQDSFEILGLGGKKTLEGKIEVKGAKNAVLKVLASSLLFKDEMALSNVPRIDDVSKMLEVLADLGVKVEQQATDKYYLITKNISNSDITLGIAQKMRSSIVITGPLLARLGQVTFPYPGGCVIGKRPIDFFLNGFAKMGAKVSLKSDIYTVTTEGKKLQGAEIFFKNQSVTGTETFLMAAVLAEGKTTLKNCALEPEIESLARFLIGCGAKIKGLGTSTLTITGGPLLTGRGKTYRTMPDRIEAGSFIILAALAGKNIEVCDCEPKHLDSLLNILRSAGVNIEIKTTSVRVRDHGQKYLATDIKTHEYPGFPTDLQAPMAVFLTQAEGQSFIFETIFEGRLNYLEALNRMGAKARVLDALRALIDGPTPLFGREVESPDLRAGLAYLLAGVIAKGKTIVHNVHYIDRGYEQIDKRLAKLGVKIKRLVN